MPETRYYDPAALRRFTAAVFQCHGLPAADAERVAECLVHSNLRGLDSHGIARIPIYAERLRRGVVAPRPTIAVERTTPVAALVDGGGGMGFLAATRAMDEAIAMARAYGLGLVGVRNSTHFGMAASYVLQAIEAGMASLVFTNASPALPPWGGRAKFLGASPFAAGAPAGDAGIPFVLDMAMTVTARGKLRLAAQRGEPIPEGIALDGEGKPTTDGLKAFEGIVLPFGGAKGAAVAMLMEVMAGAMTGSRFAGEVRSLYDDFSGPQDVGHMMLAFRPDLFMPLAEYRRRMDELVARTKAQPRAAGFEEILMAGEPETRAEAKRARTGIPVTGDVVDRLREEADAVGLVFPAGAPTPLNEEESR